MFKDRFFALTDYVFRYYLNKDDQIRSIARPDQEFNYFISKNEHLCDVQREAMNSNSLSPLLFQSQLNSCLSLHPTYAA